ncbi:3D (Asp-Asp-Asp) domain-containing protein [Ruminiclostridium sufflavum DSM 19573]|uniref:3D (Asp-Asp-Asp) domain-containing protein n=1 Tax=Ruminiclostridium sufflavum DSM 19573 TaxID=1121337 RepID=A0A318XM76_9FIRM|nr:3D domain-containing protein [Ruminiclostridium sufflavum]PYG88527.1 3D (Asp-Asp-Asp) domain-containing protein [Ruminiclostridium sufflavum DSM 19573]
MDGCESYDRNKNTTFKILIVFLVLLCSVLTFYCLKMNDLFLKYKEKYNNECVQAMVIMKSNEALVSSEKRVRDENKKLNENLNNQYNQLKKENEQIKKQINELEKQKKKIEASNNELEADNIELQKSLKKAAAVGVTPQSYNIYNSDSLPVDEKKKYLGKFLGTAYTPSAEECGNDKGITSSGQPIIPGLSVAIDNKHWPYGTVFYIKGLGYTIAMDTGSAIKGRERFDFAVLDKDFANALGLQYYDVYLVKMGNGKIDTSILI